MYGIKLVKGVGGNKGDELAECVKAGVKGENRKGFVQGVAAVERRVDLIATDFEGNV